MKGQISGIRRYVGAMNYPPYNFTSLPDQPDEVIYQFSSQGPSRIIPKVVLFNQIDRTFYNLALLDELPDGTFSDTVVSNNQDMERVLATVIAILRDFLRQATSQRVFFQGSTAARTRLYRMLIGTYAAEFGEEFVIAGVLPDGRQEAFQANREYAGFVVYLNQSTV
jgi:hypothetical protein